MPWKRCLYLQQEYPINYIEVRHVSRRRNVNEIYEDINRAIIRISVVVLFLSLFKIMMLEDRLGMSKSSWFSFISTFTENFLENRDDTGINLKPSFMLLTFAYLLSPLIRTLTLEIRPIPLYIYFAITQVLFIVDSVSASIYNTESPIEVKDEQTPLSLEESINIPKRISSNQILGLTSYFLGFILLSSRFSEPSSVFNLLCLTFMGYIILLNHMEHFGVHRSTAAIALVYVLISAMTIFPDIRIFCVYSCIVTFVYSISHISVWLLEKDLSRKCYSNKF
ncbi:putative phosphatidylinositol N-acetylglucosaminyltransferase [Encephalitozoon hellem]|nr:putative phosphatidylinositol N-acetylglucosaminyltransferase [Encephalitozoon hellem]